MPANPSASPPPAAPATAATRRRRRQLLPPPSSSSSAVPTSGSGSGASSSSSSSASSSSASSGLSFSFPSFSPAPSPFHHRFFLSPLRASAVPFSWEHRPGIPKTPARQHAAPARGSGKTAKTAALAALPLPLPPSLLSSKVGAADTDSYFIVPDDTKRLRRRRKRRPPALAATLTDWLAVLSLYRSCTSSRDCLAGKPPPRTRAPPKAGRRLIH